MFLSLQEHRRPLSRFFQRLQRDGESKWEQTEDCDSEHSEEDHGDAHLGTGPSEITSGTTSMINVIEVTERCNFSPSAYPIALCRPVRRERPHP